MVYENEIVMLLIGLGALLFIIINREKMRRIADGKLLLGGFYLLLVGWLATVIEGFIWKDFFNYIEHISYAASSVLVLLWFWKTSGQTGGPHA